MASRPASAQCRTTAAYRADFESCSRYSDAFEMRARLATSSMDAVVLRSLIASCLVAGLMLAAGWHGIGTGALLGLALSALPLTLLMGGVVHEGTAPSAAGIHLLDWTLKLVIIGAIVGSFL
ncbi:hypothetical protein [Microbacterium oxydans]|nr:hypothetical protein [Microbacterium oxydans]